MKWTPWISANVEEESLVLASPEDIASMKLSAITNRGTKKDFIDLYELLDHFSLEQMFGFYREKYTDAIPFYLKQGFLPLSKEDEGADTRLLYFDLETVKDNK